MTEDLRERLRIPGDRLDAINAVLLNPEMHVINDFLAVVAKYGTPEEINAKAQQAMQLSVLLQQIKQIQPQYLTDLQWLQDQVEQGTFISVAEYRRQLLGESS